VCFVTSADRSCPQCGYTEAGPATRDPAHILALREMFRQKTTAYAPESRVGTWAVLRPWIGLGIGFLIFVFWMRACSSGGWHLFR
jgi:hypothetical protein